MFCSDVSSDDIDDDYENFSFDISSLTTCDKLPKESEMGNIEYKRYLKDLAEDRIEHLSTQMKWRVIDGRGEAIYIIGVDDDGIIYGLDKYELKISLRNIKKMAKIINCRVISVDLIRNNEKLFTKVCIIDNKLMELPSEGKKYIYKIKI